MWIVVSRPRTDNEAEDWDSARFFGPFPDEQTARAFIRGRDMGREDKLLSVAFELEDPGA